MRIALNLLLAASCAALLATATGCGAKTEAGSDAKPAAINGNETAANDATAPATAKGGKQASDPARPVVVIETSAGLITLTLDAKQAPITVANFLSYASNGHYDQTIFHQVIKDYVVMGGAFTSELVEKKTRPPIYNEAHNSLKNTRGTIAMVRRPDVVNSATCQFYINLADNPNLDFKNRTPEEYGYCVFGQVTSGLEVVDRIGAVQVQDKPDFERIPVTPVVIKSVRQIR